MLRIDWSQYKEAFMKAHPDFKWYKLPTPPARTLFPRRSIIRTYQAQNEENCGITLGKLVDDEQLGALSSLIQSSTPVPTIISGDYNNSPGNSSMAQKKDLSISKPPKKRYIINGEFQSHPAASSIESRDYKTRNACSALLELAEICSREVIQENAPVFLNSEVKVPSWYNSSVELLRDSQNPSNYDLRNPLEISSTLQFQNSTTRPANNIINSKDNLINNQDQPLDLCKNKEKTNLCNNVSGLCEQNVYLDRDETTLQANNEDRCNNSKTITTSHQQLIDHFVDKFLCGAPTPPNKLYKSQIIDPAFYKLFSSKNANFPSTSKDSKNCHSAFTLSVAIESAIDKAYSKDNIKPTTPKSVASHCVLDGTSNSSECSVSMKQMDEKYMASHFKTHEQSVENDNSLLFDCKNNKLDSTSAETDSNLSRNYSESQSLKDADISKNSPKCSNSKYFCELESPEKKSNVCCKTFMKERLKKITDSSPNQTACQSEYFLSEFSSTRRSSQRTCKGRRYQALKTQGLLQSSKEKKQNISKKNLLCPTKVTKRNSSTNDTIFPYFKKKKPREDLGGIKPLNIQSQYVEKGLFVPMQDL